jgi:hypothetical protein
MHTVTSFRAAAVIPLVAVFLLAGCAADKQASLPPLPRELQEESATRQQVLDWAASVLSTTSDKLTSQGLELEPHGPRALFVCDPSQAIEGNSTYLVFLRWPSGFGYTGKIKFAAYRAVPPDADQQPRVVTYLQSSASEGNLVLYTLTERGFELTSQKTIHPGDGGTGVGGAGDGQYLYDQFFGSAPVSVVLVAQTFPVSTLPEH